MNEGFRIFRRDEAGACAPYLKARSGRLRASGSAALGGLLLLSACGTTDALLGGPSIQPGQPGYVRGFLGGVAIDEPRAALVARDVLSTGGSAVDAAVAAGFVLTVTLPSRAGLGGGGACLVHNPREGTVEAVMFPAAASATIPANADRPAAVPMMARGLFALSTRGGRQNFEQLIAPAEQLARFGTEVSAALANDLAAVGGPLMADPWARTAFGTPAGTPLAQGARMIQPDLGGTLASLRVSGVGDLYQGVLARRLEEVSPSTGAGLSLATLRSSIPQVVPARETRLGNDMVATLPDAGGAAVTAAFEALRSGAAPQAVGGDLPASASMVVVDRDGMAVACNFSMNNLFGTGRVAAGTGILLAAAPSGRIRPALLSPIIVHNTSTKAIRHVGAGSGQAMAPVAAAGPALLGVTKGTPVVDAIRSSVPDPGRGAAVSCPRYLPGRSEACTVGIDPRSAGIALGGVDR